MLQICQEAASYLPVCIITSIWKGIQNCEFSLIESLGPISDTTLDTVKSIRTRKTVELNAKPSYTQPNMSTPSHPVVYDIVIYCDSAR